MSEHLINADDVEIATEALLLTGSCQEDCAILLIHDCRATNGFVTVTTTIPPFLTALGSEGPSADRAKDMDLYG